MKTTADILGVNVSAGSFDENLALAVSFLYADDNTCRAVYTPNPEVIMHAWHTPLYAEVLNAGNLVVADGIGIVIASKLTRRKIKERTPGIDLVTALFEVMNENKKTAYFFGGKLGIAEHAAKHVNKRYPNIDIAGCADGYFKQKTEEEVIAEINDIKPDLLLVGIGHPAQEEWIHKNKNRINAKTAIACGGTMDVLAGHVKRAPKLLRKLGLEWLYRLIAQPKRFFRMLKLPKFIIECVKYSFKHHAKAAKTP